MEVIQHPCQKCGACCSQFQVSFQLEELDQKNYHVPNSYVVKVSENVVALKFENPHRKRCIALAGTIGKSVSCDIYLRRPSPCRKFTASFENGHHNPRCDQARMTMGLPPLCRKDWGK